MMVSLMAAACGGNSQKGDAETPDGNMAISTEKNAKGDSTLYGLACDGCTDSIIVLLPNSGGDPDTFDIINATLRRQVFGKARIGDKLAVTVNPEDSGEALKVIDLDVLKGSWCFKQMPKLRNISKMPKRLQRRILEEMSDSEKTALLVPREVGYQFKREYTVFPIGNIRHASTTDDQSMVEYTPIALYSEWRIFNGKIILKKAMPAMANAGPDKQRKPREICDTADLVLLQADSLVLRFKDGDKSFYRKRKQ